MKSLRCPVRIRALTNLAIFIAYPLFALTVQAESTPAAKLSYHLFNPTPVALMREMATDRPDTTESPITVDAGHFQVELSLYTYGYRHDKNVQSKTHDVFPSNIKIGLLNNLDVQFVFTPYENIEETSAAGTETSKGFGEETQMRVKLNLWGNDEGDTALALMPFVKLTSEDKVEGGLIIPYSVDLPNNFSLGLMAELDLVSEPEESGRSVDFVHTATIGHDLIGNLAGYLEYVGILTEDFKGRHQSIASGGLTYGMDENWVIDLGGTAGLSRDTDDFTVFLGTSLRI